MKLIHQEAFHEQNDNQALCAWFVRERQDFMRYESLPDYHSETTLAKMVKWLDLGEGEQSK